MGGELLIQGIFTTRHPSSFQEVQESSLTQHTKKSAAQTPSPLCQLLGDTGDDRPQPHPVRGRLHLGERAMDGASMAGH